MKNIFNHWNKLIASTISGMGFSRRFMLCITLFLIASCKGERNCAPDYEVYQDVRQDRLLPLEAYKPNDTLVFKTEMGILHTFISGPIDSGYKDYPYYPDEYCPTKEIQHKQYKGYFFHSATYPSTLEYLVSVAPEGSAVVYFYIIIRKHNFYTLALLSSPKYIDSLVIDGNLFQRVLPIYRNWEFTSKELVYFTLTDGIIKIFFDDGTTLTKVK